MIRYNTPFKIRRKKRLHGGTAQNVDSKSTTGIVTAQNVDSKSTTGIVTAPNVDSKSTTGIVTAPNVDSKSTTAKIKEAEQKKQEIIDILNSTALDVSNGVKFPHKKQNSDVSTTHVSTGGSNTTEEKNYSLVMIDKELRTLILQLVTTYVSYIEKQNTAYKTTQENKFNNSKSKAERSTTIEILPEMQSIRSKLNIVVKPKKLHAEAVQQMMSPQQHYGGRRRLTIPFRKRGGRKKRKRQYTRTKNGIRCRKNKKGATRLIKKRRRGRKVTRKIKRPPRSCKRK